MRFDNTFFSSTNAYQSKAPRYVVSIDFDGSVQFFTSHDDVANVPGSPIEGVLLGISATSQTLNPDRANATIGSMSFDLVDKAEAFTDHVRTELLSNDVGLRGLTCQFYMGYVTDQEGAGILDGGSTDDDPDFDNFALFQTQIVRGVETKDGRYSVKCADIQRETKRQIFELALTYLTDSISDSTTTIPVLDLSGFEGNVHGTAYTDAPSSEVIYIKLDKTKEIIRCPVSGISGNSFTNCVRGRFGTTPQAIEVDQTQESDRRPKVAEYVYLELPAVKLAYAILTGEIEGTANTLPESWHAGVDTDFVRLTDFQNIGADLWDTTDDTQGVVLRFDGINKQDAKRFLETEIYLLLGLFSPVYADGQLGLKRMVPSLADSPYSFQTNGTNIVNTSNLVHDMDSMQNNIRVDWNWNGDRFIRSTIIVDSASIARHEQALEKRLKFRGLAGTRFTEQVLRQLLTSLRDMYTGPPLRLSATGFHLLNQIEVGDACRVDVSNLRDYSQAGSNLVRTMVVHGMTVDWLSGVKLKLFGSSERADEIPPVAAAEVLPDAFYSSEGDSLSTIGGLMSGNSTNSGSFTLTGSADMNADASIFYWDNDLTISSNTTINIEGNVQLRVKGFLTINGDIDGVGEGLPVGSNAYNSGQHYYWGTDTNYGTPGFIGNSKAHKGLMFRYPNDGGIPDWVWVTDRSPVTKGRYQAFPNLVLVVEGEGNGSITGIPTDMRGGGGAYGSQAGEKTGLTGRSYQRASGGAGGSGGAALCVVCRGGDFGVSGSITLDGADGVEPTGFYAEQGGDYDIYGGAGGAGAPGALLWLLDGSSQTFPDLAGHFQARTGEVPAQYALPYVGHFGNQSLSENDRPRKNMAPFFPEDITDYDQTGVNFRILYLPDDITPTDDQGTVVPPPTGLTATAITNGVQLAWTNPTFEDFSHVEIWVANENVRANSVLLASTQVDTFIDVESDTQRSRYYWNVTVDIFGNRSVYHPDTSTTTAIAYPLIGQSPVIADPFIRQGIGAWDFSESTGGNETYEDDAGIDSDAIRVTQPTSSQVWRMLTTERRGPDEWDVQAGSEFSVEVRWRWALENDSGGVHSHALRGLVVVEDEDGSNQVFTTQLGTVYITEASTEGEWFEDSAIVNVSDSGTSPRYLRVGVELGDTGIGNLRYDIDSVDAVILSRFFAGADKPGMVSAAAGDSGKFLQGDGTWGTPTGSGVDSFIGRTGVVVAVSGDYSGFYSALGHTHVIANITDFTDNSANWNTAYGWGDHDGLYEVIDGMLVRRNEETVITEPWTFLEPIEVQGQIEGGVGAEGTGGTLDWNHVTNARSGSGYSLLLGTAANGPGGAYYYHTFGFENGTKDGSGQITQWGIPYNNGDILGLLQRTRYVGSWSDWVEYIHTGTMGDLIEITESQITAAHFSNWDDAYGWGDHASGGYAPTASPTFTGTVTLPATNLGGTLNLFDQILRRAYIDDFAIRWQSVSGVASTTIDYLDGQSVTLTMTANIGTFTINNWPGTSRLGQLDLEIVQDNPARTIDWSGIGTITWLSGAAPDLSTAGKTYAVHLSTRDGGANFIGSVAAAGGISAHTHPTSEIVSGTFADARIAQSNVTQHEAAINHDNLNGFVAAEHLDWTTDRGANNVHSANFGGGANFADTILDRAYISDFAVEHQTKSGTATTSINYSAGQSVLLTMAANITTFSITNWPATGRLGQIELEIAQDSTARTIDWDDLGTIKWAPDGSPPDLSTINATYLVHLRTRDGGTNILGTWAGPFS